MKRWIYKKYGVYSENAKALSAQCGINPVLASVLLNRGLDSPEKINTFLNISAENFEDINMLEDIQNAADRIEKAISGGEKITVYGDYDVDGITSVSVLLTYLRSRGANADYYIPARDDEGYGLNARALKKIKNSKTSLVVTVDTGITATDEVEFSKIIGLDIVVTDHHQCKDTLPDCITVNPCKDFYPFKSLAGVGVVFKLITYMENGNYDYVLDMFSDLVALGTIADVVSLTGENRIIVSRGLEKLRKNPNLGLKKLVDIAFPENRGIDTFAVGFSLAPRINAAGRIGDTGKAVELLLSDNAEECEELANYLDEQNRLRQKIEQDILNSALEIAESDEYKDKKILVISGESWNHGVIGIVASRITDKFGKPCILISCEDGIGKGSGRSVKGFNLFEALSSCGDIFVKFGGHELAAGLTLNEENIKKLDACLNAYAETHMDEKALIPCIEIDGELPCEYFNKEVISSLDTLMPFGTDNPKPVFSISGAKIIERRSLSEGKHVSFKLQKNNILFESIIFRRGELYNLFIEGDTVDVAGIIQINSWNNTDKLQIVTSEIRISGEPAQPEKIPDREDFAAVYRYLKQNSGVVSEPPSVLSRRISAAYKRSISEKMLDICLRVFAELKLLTFAQNGENTDIYIFETSKKVDLESSQILKKLKSSQGKEVSL